MTGDPIHDVSPPGVLWSRANAAEAAPGVIDPMTWTFFGRLLDIGARRGFADFGVVPEREVRCPDEVENRLFGIFHGRFAINVSTMRTIFVGLPGVSGDDVERDILGSVRPGVVDKTFGWRTPYVLGKLPVTLVRERGATKRCYEDMIARWSATVGPAGVREGVDPFALLQEAMDRYVRAIQLQGHGRLLMQGASSALTDLAAAAGDPTLVATLLAGKADLDENIIADELFELAHDRLDLDTFIARHGYHGPNVGLLSTTVWREDPAPIERLLKPLRDAERPADRAARARADREAAVKRMLAALPRGKRAGAQVLMRLGPIGARATERAKLAHLIAIDIGRAATRAAGERLVADGRLADREDAFMFLGTELVRPPAGDLRPIVAERRAQRAAHEAVDVPETWEGQPEVKPAVAPETGDVREVTGLGVSSGIVEGTARIVLDAGDDVDLEPGDILVSPITDPSWVSLMAVAGALVIDIGGIGSHGAIVARELGVPCVIGTKTGTLDLRDGDRVRVDGAAGTVSVLSR